MILSLLWRPISKHQVSLVNAAHLVKCGRPVNRSSDSHAKLSDSISLQINLDQKAKLVLRLEIAEVQQIVIFFSTLLSRCEG